MFGGADGVDGDLDVAVGAVFETDRAGQTAGKLAMRLRFGCACADGSPTHQIGNVLRRDHIQVFDAGGKAESHNVAQQFTGDAQSMIDAAATVHIRVVHQTFPTDGCTGLLEINAHDDFKVACQASTLFVELLRIFHCSLGIMNRAGADDDKKSIVVSVQNFVSGHSGAVNGSCERLFAGEFTNEMSRRRQFANLFDAKVVGCVAHDVYLPWYRILSFGLCRRA